MAIQQDSVWSNNLSEKIQHEVPRQRYKWKLAPASVGNPQLVIMTSQPRIFPIGQKLPLSMTSYSRIAVIGWRLHLCVKMRKHIMPSTGGTIGPESDLLTLKCSPWKADSRHIKFFFMLDIKIKGKRKNRSSWTVATRLMTSPPEAQAVKVISIIWKFNRFEPTD